IDKDGAVDVIRNWYKLFTRDSILFDLEEAGFMNTDIYSDAAGKAYCEESETLAMVSIKQQETRNKI
ncbi:MAG TPA: hypothetical protein VK861_04270, partial [Bacteroidales bacterium]|nr:hypothetical protein [Bacteroidales bacterium]